MISSKNFFKDKNGHVVIAQRPNIPICGWLIFRALSFFLHSGNVKTGTEAFASAFLFTWAYLEISHGVNYFRKLLGLIVLIALIGSFFRS